MTNGPLVGLLVTLGIVGVLVIHVLSVDAAGIA
jgi:hypothetical protein